MSKETWRLLALWVWIMLGSSLLGQLFSLPRWSNCGVRHHGAKTFAYKKNIPAYLEYGRRMRSGFAFQVRAMVGQNAQLIKKFKQGAYRGNKELFEAETREFSNSLLDSLQQFDGQQVPDVLLAEHTKISICHRLCLESNSLLIEAFDAEGAAQQLLVKEAEKKMKEAWKYGDGGVKQFFQEWPKIPT